METYNHSSQLGDKILQVGDIVNFSDKGFSYIVGVREGNPSMPYALKYFGSEFKICALADSLETLTEEVILMFKRIESRSQ